MPTFRQVDLDGPTRSLLLPGGAKRRRVGGPTGGAGGESGGVPSAVPAADVIPGVGASTPSALLSRDPRQLASILGLDAAGAAGLRSRVAAGLIGDVHSGHGRRAAGLAGCVAARCLGGWEGGGKDGGEDGGGRGRYVSSPRWRKVWEIGRALSHDFLAGGSACF